METETDNATLESELETWWTDFARSLRRRGRSDRTLRIYRQSWDYFWSSPVGRGASDPVDISPSMLNDWVEHEQAKGVRPSTVVLRWRNLKPFFSWWSKETEQPNPFERADVPTAPVEPVPVIAWEDLRALVAACKGRDFADRRDSALIRVLIDTGARLGELLALRLEDWDRRQDFLTLRGKTGIRTVALSAATGEALAGYVRTRAGHRAGGSEWLWVGHKADRLGARGVSQLLTRRCRQAGIAHINPHRLRHTWAHEFRSQGGSEGDLLHAAGWKSPVMAHRYGRSAAGQRAREAQRRLGLGDRL